MFRHLLLPQSSGELSLTVHVTFFVLGLILGKQFLNFRVGENVYACLSHLQARITTRLQQYRAKAELSRNTRPQAWVPREKLPRPLTSSASAIRKLMRKAELMGISTDIFPVDTSDANASMDGRRKHKQPALTADFVNYYLGEELHIQLAEAFSVR